MKIIIIFFISLVVFAASCNAPTSKTDMIIDAPVALTPPMGWNSWDCFGTSVTEAEVKNNADYMARHLKKFGWEYIVIDIDWYGPNLSAYDTSATYYKNPKPHQLIDKFGRVIPASNKFPSCKNGNFKPLADWLHQRGLKFGLHVMRGIPWQAVEKNTPIEGTSYHAQDIVKLEDGCTWYDGMRGIDHSKPGAQEYYNSLYKMFASWGVDFVKVDDLSMPYNTLDIEAVRKAINLSGRNMVLSLSPGSTPFIARNHVQNQANMFRVSEDFWDTWPQLKNQFSLCRKWSLYQKQNHWADLDMLPLGKISIRAEEGAARQTNFTKQEQVTMMTMWSIFNSPLMFGGNLPDNDEWTNSLITNEEVLAVNQTGKSPREVLANKLLTDVQQNEFNLNPVWYSESTDKKSRYVAMFNLTDKPKTVSVTFNQLKISGSFLVRDLWAKKNIGLFNEKFEQLIPPHGAVLLSIKNNK